MNGLANLNLKTEYRKGRDNIAEDFYLPCMRTSETYDRAVGFFSSAIYIIAWPSLKEFVARNGKIRLICSPVLPPTDIEAIERGYSERFEIDNGIKLQETINFMLTTPYLHKPATVLASLIALGVVDVRIAFMNKIGGHNRLFHDKLGVFSDGFGNMVAFKGSMNETWTGLSADGNLESVDVFLSWEVDRESNRVKHQVEYFDKLWRNDYECEGVIVRKFPDIVRDDLINAADLKKWPDLVEDICKDIQATEKFEARRTSGTKILRPHQSDALRTWEKNGRRGIFEHATGSGKTFTAISAMRDSLGRGEISIVLVPTELLLEQWDKELNESLLDMKPQILRCGAGFTKWRDDSLLGPWTRNGSKMPRIVLSTMQTAATSDFQTALQQGEHLFLVADEVHRTGSPNHASIFSLQTGPRLGLSATPRRAGDLEGTTKILNYFGGIVPPPFTLKDAIESGALTPYFYHVQTVSLTDEEQEKWDNVTRRIRQLAGRNSSKKDAGAGIDEQIKRLLIERSRILKQAEGKVSLATEILRKNYHAGERWLVYCDDLEQLRSVRNALKKMEIESTEYHSAMEGSKDQTIRLFQLNGGILVSIKCLDEGVDIPSVGHALILASSKNPREYIQRRGRVLRRAEGKSVAHIYDAFVLPATEYIEGDQDPHLKIIEGEIARSLDFGKSALNPSAITDLERIALRFTNDYKTLINSGYEDEDDD